MTNHDAAGGRAASLSPLLGARIRIPRHVVYRCFPAETVLLNVNTGRYHGVGTAAAGMLDALEQASCLREAARAVARGRGQAPGEVEQHMCELCEWLLERGLIEIAGATV